MCKEFEEENDEAYHILIMFLTTTNKASGTRESNSVSSKLARPANLPDHRHIFQIALTAGIKNKPRITDLYVEPAAEQDPT